MNSDNPILFSEIISNFNYSSNPFISNGQKKNATDTLLNSPIYNNQYDDQKNREHIENQLFDYIKNSDRNQAFADRKNTKLFSSIKDRKENHNAYLDEIEKAKTLKSDRVLLMSMIKQIPEYEEYKDIQNIIRKKLKLALSVYSSIPKLVISPYSGIAGMKYWALSLIVVITT